MNMRQIMETAPVIPVLVIDEPRQAVPLARALVGGGLRVLEVTLRTPVALKVTQAIVKEVPEAIVGVGTITRPEQLLQAKEAGARFCVSPALRLTLLESAKSIEMPFLPGVMTPSEVLTARCEGFQELKLFPAAPAGGIAMLKALGGPFPHAVFCPTGGITAATFADYLALDNVLCVSGSWLTPRTAVAQGDWVEITRLAREAVDVSRGVN